MIQTFLELIHDALINKKSNEKEIDYKMMYEVSNKHQVSSLIYNQIYSFESFPSDLKNHWKKDAIFSNTKQFMKTDRFIRIYKRFIEEELIVLVVKGIILRNLYPIPENRPSNDEDLYVSKKDFDRVKEIFLEEGFVIVDTSDDVTTFADPKTQLHIELHTELFSKTSKAYGNYQEKFNDAFDHIVTHNINGVTVYSLDHDYHFLFLLMHFVKHFLHGGVGIRQVADIVMYAHAFGSEIHWDNMYETLDELHVLTLIENVFALAHDYLGFDYSKIQLPKNDSNHDYEPLLLDIIDAGVFGKSSIERLHSSTMTLNALSDKGKSNVFKSIFPTLTEMKGKFEYLNKYPFLLPIAWCTRIFNYIFDKKQGDSKKTIEIGNERIELLKKYHMIKKN